MAAVKLSELRDEIWDLAERPDPLSEADEHRWHQLIPHWIGLADRILRDRN